MRLIIKIFNSKPRKIIFLFYLLTFILSVSASCHFYKLNESVIFLSCTLQNFILLSISYGLTLSLTFVKKHKLIKSLVLIPLVLLPLASTLGSGFAFIYLKTDIFKNRRLGERTCVDGRQIPCETNKDCKWEKLVEYCSPSKVNPSQWDCAPSIKCSPRKICEDYCH